MNRREFCQTVALFFAGSVCAGVPLCAEKRTTRFRAQKIFLESWDAENAGGNSSHIASFVRQKMESISGNGYNGLLLIPDQRSLLKWGKLIEAEGNRLGLTVFLPACLTNNFLRKVQTVTPLEHETGILQSITEMSADNDGILLLDRADNTLGIVLYDSSRCLWSGFVPQNAGIALDALYDANSTRLVAARWIDYVRALS